MEDEADVLFEATRICVDEAKTNDMSNLAWTTSKGQTICIRNMNVFHIRKCIEKLQLKQLMSFKASDKEFDLYQYWIDRFEKELEYRKAHNELEKTPNFEIANKDIECCANCKYRESKYCKLQIIKNIKPASSCYRCEIKEK